MLASYEVALLNLLQTPLQPTPLIAAAQQIIYINTARGQVAGEGECIRIYGSLALVINQRTYPFSAITFGGALGVSGVNNVRTMWFQVPATPGQAWMTPRAFEWFGLYKLNNATPTAGQPQEWAQLGQGQNGTLFIDPLPDLPYVCPLDASAAPALLTNDTDPEAIPPLWQDAVPFYAAWLAFMNLQREADADKMMERYKTLMARARGIATPSVLAGQYAQAPDAAANARMQPTQRPAGA